MTSHGVLSKYTHGACRCTACTGANTKQGTRRRAQRLALRSLVNGRLVAPVADDMHGLVSTYTNHGCRCEPCTRANIDSCAERRHRRPVQGGAA